MYDNQEMEMPTPCQKCGEIFDLLDGAGSEKWFPSTVICKSCSDKEQDEITIDEEVLELRNNISDALWTIKDCVKELKRYGLYAPNPDNATLQDYTQYINSLK
jgi:hypothetical protein